MANTNKKIFKNQDNKTAGKKSKNRKTKIHLVFDETKRR